MNDLDQIDQTWDEIVTNPGHVRGDDAMSETMLRLHSLAAETVSAQSIDRVWGRLGISSRPNSRQGGQRVSLIRPVWRALDSRPMSAVATVALLALVTLSGYFAISGNRTSAPSNEVSYRVLTKGYDQSDVTEIDPLTLADVLGGWTYPSQVPATPSTGGVDYSHLVDDWIASADGTRLIGWVHEVGSVIIVVDPVIGTELRRFPIASTSSAPTLNASGSRIAVAVGAKVGAEWQSLVVPNNPIRWHIYDTTTGQLLTQIESQTDRDPMLFDVGWFDPNGRLFYRLSIDHESRYPGPWPVQLVVHDAQSGAERGRLDLPSVQVGTWPAETSNNATACSVESAPINRGSALRMERAGITISPDGATMAIVEPDGREITLVDLRSLQVARTLTLPTNEVEPPSAATPTADSDTGCSTSSNDLQSALFSTDGASLYVMGLRSLAASQTLSGAISTPMMRIDVASGAVEASVTTESVDSMTLWPWLIQSPDGSSLYTVRYSNDRLSSIIERRDPETLEVVATREFTPERDIIITAK